MGNLLSFSFWFRMRPGDMPAVYFRTLLGILAVMLVLAVLFYFLKRSKSSIYRKIWLKLHNFFLGNLIIGAFLAFFIYERLAFLSMRAWLAFWFIGMAVWLGFIFRQFIQIPQIRENIAKEREFRKYLPR